MSVPSVKTIVTAAKPYLLTERTCVTFGSPFIATSTGNVANRSTSTGERPGASISTWTCASVRSGNASTRSVERAHRPAPTNARTMATTVVRCRTAHATRRSAAPEGGAFGASHWDVSYSDGEAPDGRSPAAGCGPLVPSRFVIDGP